MFNNTFFLLLVYIWAIHNSKTCLKCAKQGRKWLNEASSSTLLFWIQLHNFVVCRHERSIQELQAEKRWIDQLQKRVGRGSSNWEKYIYIWYASLFDIRLFFCYINHSTLFTAVELGSFVKKFAWESNNKVIQQQQQQLKISE